jgi:hypothetical protein
VGQRTEAHGRAVIFGARKRFTSTPPATDPEPVMNINSHISIGPLVSLIAGVLILLVPRLLNYIVAIYLIIIGLLGLFGGFGGLRFH